jgi:hypothetical protein
MGERDGGREGKRELAAARAGEQLRRILGQMLGLHPRDMQPDTRSMRGSQTHETCPHTCKQPSLRRAKAGIRSPARRDTPGGAAGGALMP